MIPQRVTGTSWCPAFCHDDHPQGKSGSMRHELQAPTSPRGGDLEGGAKEIRFSLPLPLLPKRIGAEQVTLTSSDS